jgi:vacuolar-type H+-ATPase subunit E/Vma4
VEELRAKIMSEVERDQQRVLQEAQSQAQGILAEARRDAESEKDRIIDAAETEAERIDQQMIGAARLEAQALKTRAREDLLDQVFRHALERIADPEHIEGYRDALENLIRDAVDHLAGHPELLISADPKSRRYLDDAFLARLSEMTGRRLALAGELEPPGVGVVITSPDGRVRYDNTLQTRLRRMRDALRPVVYRTLIGEAP